MMKNRSGFVSNSSSSSFILAFNNKPRTYKDIYKEVFNNRKKTTYKFSDGTKDEFDNIKLSKMILKRINKSNKFSKSEIIIGIANSLMDFDFMPECEKDCLFYLKSISMPLYRKIEKDIKIFRKYEEDFFNEKISNESYNMIYNNLYKKCLIGAYAVYLYFMAKNKNKYIVHTTFNNNGKDWIIECNSFNTMPKIKYR